MLRQQELRRIAKQLRPLVARRDFSLLSLRNVPLVANRISISLNHPEFTTKTYPQFSMKYSTNNGKTFEIKVPEMGESITEATVVEWLKQPGDKVEADETIAVLETDKVSVDVKSPESGVILKHLAKVDATVLVGKPLVELTMESSAAVAQSLSTKTNKPVETEQEQEEKQEKTKSPIVENQGELMDITIPAMGESIVEGTIVECNKKSGDYVNAGEVIAVLETDKISVDVKSEFSGIVKEVLATQGDVIKVGASLMRVVKGDVPEQKTPVKVEAEKLPPAASEPSKDVSIQNEGIKGSSSAKSTNITKSSESNAVAASESRTFTRTKMNRMRLRIAERLKESQNIAASLTTFQECDMGNLMDLRKSYKDTFEKKHGVKLGFMSAFVKASASALLEFPAINSMIDDDKMEIVQPNYVDISVAVSTGKGLVTPVIKDCEHLSFADIEKTLANLALRARDGKLTMADMTGGNFTISNGGVFGSLMGTPILNRPQSAILGMHATKMRPVLYKNQVVPRPMMYLALTYDHRLVDGREAVLFLKSIADKIEDPQRLMLDL